MLAASMPSCRLLLAAAVGVAVMRARHLVQHPKPPPEPEIICTIPDVDLSQRLALPPPSDAEPPASERRVVIADLLSRGSAMSDCGTFLFESTMVFTDVLADSATLRVLVPCAEM